MNLRSVTTSTPDGDFHLIIDSDDIVRVSGFGALEDLVGRLPQELLNGEIESVDDHDYEKRVRAYYSGDGAALDGIARFQDGSEFQKKVWKAISDVPHGQTISYKQLAQATGQPGAFRAAGTICGLNRLILLVPCHRVLKSDGGIGSYLYGPTIKASLLAREAL